MIFTADFFFEFYNGSFDHSAASSSSITTFGDNDESFFLNSLDSVSLGVKSVRGLWRGNDADVLADGTCGGTKEYSGSADNMHGKVRVAASLIGSTYHIK